MNLNDLAWDLKEAASMEERLKELTWAVQDFIFKMNTILPKNESRRLKRLTVWRRLQQALKNV